MTDLERAERGFARQLVWNYRLKTEELGRQVANEWLERILKGVARTYGTSDRVRHHMREMWIREKNDPTI